MILYDFFPETKVNVCFIYERDYEENTNFYFFVKENEGFYESKLIGNLSDSQKEEIINEIRLRGDVPDFFKDYLVNKITLFVN